MDEMRNTTVRFPVAEVLHPRPAQVLMELFRLLFLEGTILAETTDGQETFLVVRVPGVSEPLIIPKPVAEKAPVADAVASVG